MAIFVVCFMYIYKDIIYIYRLYEKYEDIPTSLNLSACRADIEGKPVEGVKNNLSGLTWSDKHKLLFAVVNNPPELIWLTKEGDRVGSMTLPEFEDTEAVEWVGKDVFYIGSEKNSTAWMVKLDLHAFSYTVISKIKFNDYATPKNNGLEGLAWDKEKQHLYSAKEKIPIIISRIFPQSDDAHIKIFPTVITSSLKDVSGLHYHPLTSSLLILSDESKIVVEVNPVGRITDRLYLDAGWSGLTKDIKQAEGITIDDKFNLYIVSEPNLFYRFTKS